MQFDIFIGWFGFSLLTTLNLVEAKVRHRQKSKFAKEPC
jgi:hypothetical protein